jgi:epoxyqueuosine reductase
LVSGHKFDNLREFERRDRMNVAAMTTPIGLAERLKSEAQTLGFAQFGIAPAVTPTGFHKLLEWLANGYAGQMQWMERRVDAYRHPEGVMKGTRSVLVAALNYHDGTTPSATRVARYASGTADYHDILKPRLRQLADFIRTEIPGAKTRVVIDTAPLLERDFARLAGIGWFGKNTMLISRSFGSYFFLGAILTDVQLEYDQATNHSYCGTCTKCLDACPTQAFPEPGVLDARRCISYLTIEQRKEPVPEELRAGIGNWLFGCDICQEVCPWNRFAPTDTLTEFRQTPAMQNIDCRELMILSEQEFTKRFEGTPLARPGRAGLLRNAAMVLGNQGDPAAIPVLEASLTDEEFLIRDAAAWALEKLRRE